MGVAHEHGFGPYTVYDLDALPDEGKGYELADGWLIPLSPSPRHDMAADILRDRLRDAARAAGAKVGHRAAPRQRARGMSPGRS